MLGRYKGLKVDIWKSVMLAIDAWYCSFFLHVQDSMEMVISPTSSLLKSKKKKSMFICTVCFLFPTVAASIFGDKSLKPCNMLEY